MRAADCRDIQAEMKVEVVATDSKRRHALLALHVKMGRFKPGHKGTKLC